LWWPTHFSAGKYDNDLGEYGRCGGGEECLESAKGFPEAVRSSNLQSSKDGAV